MSRLGLYFCIPYALFVALCFGAVSLGGVGYASHLMYLQLPIAPQLALAHWLGLHRAIDVIAWPDAYGLLMTPAFLLLYASGATLERSLRRRRVALALSGESARLR